MVINMNYTKTAEKLKLPKELMNARGAMPFTLMNDYMFHVTFQSNEIALKGLICALLKLEPGEIRSVEVMNPIIPGEYADEKSIILDLKVNLNNTQIINIEMQVLRSVGWIERSLYYLCRNFAELKHGDNYCHVKKNVQISITNFPIFNDGNELYDTYTLRNEKNKIYSDKLSLGVLDLSQTEEADEASRKTEIYKWARLFKSKTWEDFIMNAMENEAMQQTVFSLHRMTEDEKIRYACEARERYEMEKAAEEFYREELKQETERLKKEADKLKDEKDRLKSETDKLKDETDKLKDETDKLKDETNKLKDEKDKLKDEKDRLKDEKDKLRSEAEQLEGEAEQLRKEKEAILLKSLNYLINKQNMTEAQAMDEMGVPIELRDRYHDLLKQ